MGAGSATATPSTEATASKVVKRMVVNFMVNIVGLQLMFTRSKNVEASDCF